MPLPSPPLPDSENFYVDLMAMYEAWRVSIESKAPGEHSHGAAGIVLSIVADEAALGSGTLDGESKVTADTGHRWTWNAVSEEWTDQGKVGIGVMPSGIEKTGGIIGGDYKMNAVDPINDIDFGEIVCMDSTNLSEIISTATVVKRLDDAWVVGTNQGGLLNGTKAINTIYHLYALLKDSDSTVDFGYLEDGDAITICLPVGYSTYKWIGFVRTNPSGGICSFVMQDDILNFGIASENYIGTFSTTAQVIDHSPFIPVSMVAGISYGSAGTTTSAGYVYKIDAAGNNIQPLSRKTNVAAGDTTGWGWGIDYSPIMPLNADLAIECSATASSAYIAIKAVKLKR